MIDHPTGNTAEHRPPLPDGGPRSPSLDAFDYLRAAWTRRRLALVAALVLAGFGTAWSLLSPRRYEASLTLAVVASKVGEPAVTTVPPQSVQETSVANFAPIISSHAAVTPIVKEFQLDQAPRNITPAVFLEKVLTVKPLVDTNLVRVIVELDDPELAAKVTNRLVDTSIALARTVAERGISSTLSDLKRVLDQAEARMMDAEARYDEDRRTARVELPKKSVENSRTKPGVFKNGAGASGMAQVDDLYTRESLLSRRELERTIARSSFESAALRYQAAHLEAVGRTPQVVVVDSAVPPEEPVSRLLVRNIALGLLTGVLLGLLVAAADILRAGRRRTRPA